MNYYMIEILISLIAILFLMYLSKMSESFNCKSEQYLIQENVVKQETIDSVLDFPRDSIDPLFDASFKPECCPSTYTSSRGCLCYEPKNFNLLATRGGNALSNPL